MSRGTKLQEMEQSKTAVNANAAPAAFVEGIMEGKDWVWDGGGLRAHQIAKTYKTINTLVDKKQLDESKLNVFNDFLNSL